MTKSTKESLKKGYAKNSTKTIKLTTQALSEHLNKYLIKLVNKEADIEWAKEDFTYPVIASIKMRLRPKKEIKKIKLVAGLVNFAKSSIYQFKP